MTAVPASSSSSGAAKPLRAMIAAAILLLIVLAAVFAPWIAPQNPYDMNAVSIMDGRLPPGSVGDAGFTFWLGSDDQGRDMLSAILYGLRVSLFVGFAVTLGAAVIGSIMGLTAALAGGLVDSFIMRFVELQLSFPAMLIALMLVATVGSGLDKIIFAIIAVQWAFYARTIRSAAQVEVRKDYIEAARCLSLSRWRIMAVHLLPNCLSVLLVIANILMANAIVIEATMSFLGLGLPISRPSLGRLIANGFDYLLNGSYWISLFPGIVLVVVIYCINIIGDDLRRFLNPRGL
jgi:peptide/nickel transport system permease protein